MAKTIYRGYEVEEREGETWVSKDGSGRSFQSVALAYAWIDAERKKQIEGEKKK